MRLSLLVCLFPILAIGCVTPTSSSIEVTGPVDGGPFAACRLDLVSDGEDYPIDLVVGGGTVSEVVSLEELRVNGPNDTNQHTIFFDLRAPFDQGGDYLRIRRLSDNRIYNATTHSNIEGDREEGLEKVTGRSTFQAGGGTATVEWSVSEELGDFVLCALFGLLG